MSMEKLGVIRYGITPDDEAQKTEDGLDNGSVKQAADKLAEKLIELKKKKATQVNE